MKARAAEVLLVAVVVVAAFIVAAFMLGDKFGQPTSTLLSAILASTVAFLAFLLNVAAHDRTTEAMNEAQDWKRREFVGAWFERLRADELAQTAMHALDQSGARLRIQAPKEWNGGDRPKRFSTTDSEYLVRIGTEMTFMALAPHNLVLPLGMKFTDEQMQLKRCFDALFSRLGELQAMETAKLITYKEIKPYIRYWMELLGGERRSSNEGRVVPAIGQREHLFRALKLYLDVYGYSDVILLAAAFEKDLKVTEEDTRVVKRELKRIQERHRQAATQSETTATTSSEPLTQPKE